MSKLKYTIKHDEVVETKLSGETNYAIALFVKLQKAEKKVEKLTETLGNMVANIPVKDMGHYVAITGELER